MEVSDEFYYEGTRGTFKFNVTAPAKPRLIIHNAGEFFVNDSNKLDFEGDAEEAGRLFAEYVCRCYNKYIETLLAEERKIAIDEILNEIETKNTHHQTGNIISEIFPCVLDELKQKYGIKESE